MSTIVFVIADYGALHDLAFAEVKQKASSRGKKTKMTISTFAALLFDTVATGFVLAQTALTRNLGERQKILREYRATKR